MAAQDVRDELLKEKQHFVPLLAISPTAIVITDIDGLVVAWNPAAERLFGYSESEATGRNLDDLVAKTEEVHAEAVGFTKRASAKDQVHTIARRTHKDGSLVDVELLAAPLVVHGRTVGTLGLYHDITELQRQKQYYEALLQASPTAIIAIDPQGNVTSWNPAAEQLFGYAAEEAIGRDVDDLVANREELREEALDLNRRMADGEVRLLTRRTRKDGSLVDVEVTGAPIHVGGELVGMYGLFHDVSELQRQKRYFQSLLELSPTAIVVADLDGKVTSWNPAAEKLFGYTTEDAMGRSLDELVAMRPDLHQEAVGFTKAADRGERVQVITRRTRKDGSLVDVELIQVPVVIGEEQIGFLVIYHDISELQEQKRYFQSLLELSPTAIVVTDLDSKIVSWNPAAEQLFGYTPDEALGRHLDDLVANRSELREEALGFSRASARGERVDVMRQRTRKDGSLVDVHIISASVVIGDERLGYMTIYHDISDIQRQKRYYEALFQSSPVAVALLDPKGTVTSWNPAAERLFGYTAGEAVGQNIDDLVAADELVRAEAMEQTQTGMGGGFVHSITRRTHKDGTLLDVECFGSPVIVAGEPVGLYAMYHDIGEIQRQKRYYEALFQSSPVAVALLDPNGTVTSWNPAARRLFGYTEEEAVGRNIDDLVAVSDEVRAEAEDLLHRGMGGELIHAITKRTRKDGTLVDVEIFGAPVMVAGEPAGLYSMYHDIGELQRARQDAEAATEAKSAFLATMSHEIRTPLNAVIGMTGLLLDTKLSAEQREFAEVIRGSGDALLSVINDILDFSKIEAGRLELERSPFDLRDCVESALELVAAGALKKGLDLAYDLEPDVPAALVGDLTRLRQVFLNLLNNAVKFTERGEVVVTGKAERLGPTDAGRYRLSFAVRDTGIGIPEDRRDRLFESFSQVDRSTTRRYGGTGLGLAISKRLVELMGGTLWAESSLGGGSTFHFTIEADEAPAPVRPFEQASTAQLEGRRILIVDDNATNRQILSRQTQAWGMIARETERPEEALEWIRRGDPFDVGVLDMQMPEMDGVTLAGEIRRYRDAPSFPLVMLTSLGRSEDTPGANSFAAFLTKPIKPSQLYDALLGIFGGGPEMVEVPVAPEAGELAQRLPLRILLVEDNAVNQQLALLLLQKMGYRADVAANGMEALEALGRQPYDVVLMDVEMPEMDGLEATRRIHQLFGRDRRPRIIAVTANAMREERELCLQAGMDDYITKPIRIEVLASALGRARPLARTSDAGQTLDADVIRRLVDSFGDQAPTSVGGIITTFLDQAPAQLAELRRAVDRGRAEDVRRGAHTMKSNAATFGATALAKLCRELEAMAASGTLAGAEELHRRLELEWESVRQALERLREEL